MSDDKQTLADRLNRRETLIDEINHLVTSLGPQILHRGMSVDEAYEAIYQCLKQCDEKLKTAVPLSVVQTLEKNARAEEQRRRELEKILDAQKVTVPPWASDCHEEGVPI